MAAIGTAGTLLTSCTFAAKDLRPAGTNRPVKAYRTVTIPHLTWYAVTVGPQVLMAEGTQISSVLAGPDHRIYYGTQNPLADANVIGWINPSNGQSRWTTVPAVSPPFPKGSALTNLNLTESAYWGSVDLVVAGSKTVWYRHWGYLGGWDQDDRFVTGTYAIPGPTVHDGQWTASIQTSFAGQRLLRIMNLHSQSLASYSLPDHQPVVAMAFVTARTDDLWVMTSTDLWQLNGSTGQWTLLYSLPAGDFFISLGHWNTALWVVDADGKIGTISGHGVHWLASLPVAPLKAVTAGHNGLWVASLHHLLWWRPGHRPKTWLWPANAYPRPASQWPTTGADTPPDWPPLPHISAGPQGTLDIGYGTWVGLASLSHRQVTVISHPSGHSPSA